MPEVNRTHSDSPSPLPLPSPLQLRLIGRPGWTSPGSSKLVPLAMKDAALLAKLALDGPQSRLALCELLWPSSSGTQAFWNLRSRSSRLHKTAGVPFVVLGQQVALHTDVEVDVLRLEQLDAQLLLAMPPLLAGVDLGDHDAIDRWLAEARERVESRMAGLLADRAEALEAEGRLHEALALASRLAERLPASEQAARRVMRLHYRRGEGARAEDVYLRLRALLREDYGRLPDAETELAYRTIVAARTPLAPVRRPMPLSLLRPPILIGRREPCAAMAAAWQAGAPFVLVGASGLGKTRLIEAYTDGAEGCIVHGARPGDDASPHALFGRLLLQIDERHAPAVDRAVRDELARAAHALGTEPVTSGHLNALRQAAETWFAAALASGLRSIVVDDAHKADPASLQMLRWLGASPSLAALRLGLAAHPSAPDSGVGAVLAGWTSDSHRLVPITLQPLSAVELAELLASLALPMVVDPAVVARLHRRTGGHPLYTLATLQHAVSREGDMRTAEALNGPDSVHALLDARVAALPSGCRPLLQVAAVGGADLSVERAAQLLGSTALSLADAWSILETHDVLRGEAFSHDLVHAAALRSVPKGLQQALHRQWAALLVSDGDVLPARLAAHWEAGLRWREAGRAWTAAATAARQTGSLDEHSALCLRAATCHAEAGDRVSRAEALLARLEGLQLRHGGGAVLDALPDVEQSAATPQQRLRCLLTRTEAYLDQQRAEDAVAEAGAALATPAADADAVLEARAQRAIGLAQCHRPGDALAEVVRAAAEVGERDSVPSMLRLKVCNARMYVHWSAGRLPEAIAAQRDELGVAEGLGDRVLIAASEVSLASLLAVSGDVAATYAHAREAQKLQLDTGLAEDNPAFILNRIVFGNAAAALGRYDEALAALQAACGSTGNGLSIPLRSKATLACAGLWLALGRPDLVRTLAAKVPAAAPPGMQLQAAWWVARAAETEGVAVAAFWARFDRLVEMHSSLPPVRDAAFESSYRGSPEQVIRQLTAARAECEASARIGTARALHWRELMRWLERSGSEATHAALACAEALSPHVEAGFGTKVHAPEVLEGLARAYARAGDAALERSCTARAQEWLKAACARLPPEHRHDFLSRNPVHRRLMAGATSPH